MTQLQRQQPQVILLHEGREYIVGQQPQAPIQHYQSAPVARPYHPSEFDNSDVGRVWHYAKLAAVGLGGVLVAGFLFKTLAAPTVIQPPAPPPPDITNPRCVAFCGG